MYESPQKKNSSWTPSTVQKKGKSPSKLGHFSIQPKPNPSSTSSQEIGEYSRDSADRLTANVMRGIQAKKQEEAEGSTLQPKSESPWAPTFEPPPPLPESPASKLKGAFAPVSKNPIQRQCAECAKEEKEQVGEQKKDVEEIGIQTKLTVGAPGDSYEQEADRMASQVMSMSAPTDSSASVQRQLDTNHPHHPHQIWQRAQSIKPVMQRQIDPRVQMREMIQRAHQIDSNQASGDLESRLNASKGGGSPLSENVRGFMEPRFGADFSGVRVHTGGEAVQMNKELGAQAFTHGSDVYFGQGKEPGNNELTAHELTHVVQQTGNVSQKQNFILNRQTVTENTSETVKNSSDSETVKNSSEFEKLKNAYQPTDVILKEIPFSPWAIKVMTSDDGGTCAARMSNAYNRAGLDRVVKTAQALKVCAPCWDKDPKKVKYYILRADEFAKAVGVNNSQYRVKDKTLNSIKGKQGIIWYKHFHIDLWDGNTMTLVGNGENYKLPRYKAKDIYFKEL